MNSGNAGEYLYVYINAAAGQLSRQKVVLEYQLRRMSTDVLLILLPGILAGNTRLIMIERKLLYRIL